MMFTVSSCAFIQWISLIQLLKPLVLMLLGIWYYAVRLVEFTDALAASGYVTSFVISVCIVGAPFDVPVLGLVINNIVDALRAVWWLFAEFSFTMINLIDFKLIVIAHFRSIGFIGCEVRLHFVHFTLNIGVMCCCGLWFAASVLLALMVYLVSGFFGWKNLYIFGFVGYMLMTLCFRTYVICGLCVKWQVCSSFLVVLSWSCGDIKQIVFGMLCLDVLWVLLTLNGLCFRVVASVLLVISLRDDLCFVDCAAGICDGSSQGIWVSSLLNLFEYVEYFCFDAFSQVEFPMKWVWVRVKF
eukprot:gene13090-8936_t